MRGSVEGRGRVGGVEGWWGVAEQAWAHPGGPLQLDAAQRVLLASRAVDEKEALGRSDPGSWSSVICGPTYLL